MRWLRGHSAGQESCGTTEATKVDIKSAYRLLRGCAKPIDVARLFMASEEYLALEIECRNAEAVMAEWQTVNEQLGLRGEMHLDLCVERTV